ncbi:hypothetical protein ACFQ2B_38925 [Streptomyces stramineus]
MAGVSEVGQCSAGAGGAAAPFLTGRADVALADVGFSLASGRSVFDHRAVVLAGDRDGFLDALRPGGR